MASNHKYSRRSYGYLKGCEPVLTEFSERLLARSKTDLSISKYSVRDEDQQKILVDKGVSKTMDSAHLPNERGLSEAVDIHIYIKGVNVWKLQSVYDLYEDLHAAAQLVACEMNLDVLSGACWDNLNQGTTFYKLLWLYRNRKYRQGKKAFFDGPHFELIT